MPELIMQLEHLILKLYVSFLSVAIATCGFVMMVAPSRAMNLLRAIGVSLIFFSIGMLVLSFLLSRG